MRRPLRATALVAVAVLLAGCDLLWAMSDPWGVASPWDDEPFPQPTVLATYTQGTASIEITRGGEVEMIAFDRVSPGSKLEELMGATVSWRNDDGWVLTVTDFDYYSDVSVHRIVGLDHWRADGYDLNGQRCFVEVDEKVATGLSGVARCYRMRWADGLTPTTLEPTYIEGEEPFDAEVTFEAVP